jgi:hypothetical protein
LILPETDEDRQKKAEELKKALFYDPWPECPPDGCAECEKTNCPQRDDDDEDNETCPHGYTIDECAGEGMAGIESCEFCCPWGRAK